MDIRISSYQERTDLGEQGLCTSTTNGLKLCVGRVPSEQQFELFQLCSSVLTGGENGLDGFAPQGPTQGLQFHRVLRRGAQLCQAVGSWLRVQDEFLWRKEIIQGNLRVKK